MESLNFLLLCVCMPKWVCSHTPVQVSGGHRVTNAIFSYCLAIGLLTMAEARLAAMMPHRASGLPYPPYLGSRYIWAHHSGFVLFYMRAQGLNLSPHSCAQQAPLLSEPSHLPGPCAFFPIIFHQHFVVALERKVFKSNHKRQGVLGKIMGPHRGVPSPWNVRMWDLKLHKDLCRYD